MLRQTGTVSSPPRRVTMKQVADHAGVHVSTVSRVLSRADGGRVQAESETSRRIRYIARELGYVPDPAAASLRTQRTKVIGVLVPRLTDIVLATIYEGIEETATRHGYQTVVSNSHDDLDERRRRIDLLVGRRVDGLILGDAHRDGDFLDSLAARGIQAVLVSRHAPGLPSVTCDDFRGGRLVGTHLADLGHRRIGIAAGLPWASTGLDRTAGCIDSLAERGIVVPDRMVVNCGFDAAGGRDAADQLLRMRPRPTAIFATNDFAAIGVMGAIRDRALRVGADVAVVGFNDITIARDMPVPLTTVRSPMREMGAVCTELLLDLLQGRPAESVRLQPELVVRQSSDPSVRLARPGRARRSGRR